MRKILYSIMFVLLCAGVSAVTVTRSFDTDTLGPNEILTVTLTVDLEDDDYYVLEETVPDHMEILSVTSDDGYAIDDKTIKILNFLSATDTVITYSVNVGSASGIFFGEYGPTETTTSEIAGETDVTVIESIPEFTTVGLLIGLFGGLLIFAWRRK